MASVKLSLAAIRDGRQIARLLTATFEDGVYRPHSAVLPPSATLIFYTDGLIEFNRDTVEREERLMRFAMDLQDKDAGAVAQALVRDVLRDAFPVDRCGGRPDGLLSDVEDLMERDDVEDSPNVIIDADEADLSLCRSRTQSS